MGVHWTILASFLQAWGPSKCTYQRNGPWADDSPTDETDWEQSLSAWCQCSLEGLSSQLRSGSCLAVAGEWSQVHATGCVTVWTGKSRLLPDGDTIMGCSDIPVGVHARTPPTPSWGHREALKISHHAHGMSQLGRVAWDPHTSLWDPHLTPPRAALPHSSRSKASVHKSPKHFASLHSVGNYHILSANCVPPNNLTRQVRLLLLMLFQSLSVCPILLWPHGL